MSTARVGARYQVVIPADVRARVAIRPGDEVVVEEVDGVVVLFPRPSCCAEWIYGLGREIWEGEDGEAYLERERSSWR